ncbi:MAG: hypothetical protein AUH91_01135 [Verrucomicrobia bacterium 13_1_40CM_4_54_4]|nr:MAG: hypothetical protein AUH91_01135 [Verrucomicrobia bacterium 13_1_40CM_4_54_4]
MVEPRDHSEIRRFRQIQWITNGDDWGCHLQFLRFSDRHRGSYGVYFQHRRAAADIRQKLAGWIFLAVKFNCEISRFTANGVCCVKRSCRINKESGAGNLAVLIDTVNLDHRLGGMLKDLFNLVANCGGGLLLSVNQGDRREEKAEREAEAEYRPELKPERELRRATKI